MRRDVCAVLGLVAYLLVTTAGLAQQPKRVQEGLVALYTFVPPEFRIPDLGAAEDPGALTVHGDVVGPTPEEPGVTLKEAGSALRSEGGSERIITALSESGQMTLEVWLKPALLEQSGPARVVSISAGTGHERNFTLGQEGSRYIFRLRTAKGQAQDAFRVAQRNTPEDAVLLTRHHVMVTYKLCPHCGAGTLRLFVNGEPALERRDLRGDFSTWELFPLLMGNEIALDRQWRGTLYLVAVYDRALSPTEVKANFAAGIVRPE